MSKSAAGAAAPNASSPPELVLVYTFWPLYKTLTKAMGRKFKLRKAPNCMDISGGRFGSPRARSSERRCCR